MEKQATIPEIGKTVSVNGVRTNYHEQGEGPPLLLIHGSGPGVTAWANWGPVRGWTKTYAKAGAMLVGCARV